MNPHHPLLLRGCHHPRPRVIDIQLTPESLLPPTVARKFFPVGFEGICCRSGHVRDAGASTTIRIITTSEPQNIHIFIPTTTNHVETELSSIRGVQLFSVSITVHTVYAHNREDRNREDARPNDGGVHVW